MARTKKVQRAALAAEKAKTHLVEDYDDIPSKSSLPRRKRRYRPGTVSLRQIRHLQETTDFACPRAPFKRVVKDIVREVSPLSFSITKNAHLALQTAAEDFLTSLFREINRSARNAKRIKIKIDDFHLVHDLVTKGLPELMNEDTRFTFDGKTLSAAQKTLKEEMAAEKTAERKEHSRLALPDV